MIRKSNTVEAHLIKALDVARGTVDACTARCFNNRQQIAILTDVIDMDTEALERAKSTVRVLRALLNDPIKE